MGFLESDEFLSMIVPLVVYWVYSIFCEMLNGLDKYRLHSKQDEQTKNLVSKHAVVSQVLLQQAIQATITLTIFKLTQSNNISSNTANSSSDSTFIVVIAQFFVAMIVFDAWQYFIHRCMHMNKFMYRNFHSWHHRLYAPYAYGAQYNHPVDGILTEMVAGPLAFFISGMSVKTSIFFFCFTTIKGIDDHSGLMLPWNPFHFLFGNNTAYHEVHHQLDGIKCNFAGPFFMMWDKIMGTYVPYKLQKRDGGGYEAKIVKLASD